MLRFWAAGTVFHVGLGLVSLRVAGRWQRRLESPDSWPAWVKSAGADGLVFMTSSILLALAASVIGPRSGFTAVRFLSQALFGEVVLLAAVLAWLHAKGRLRGRATGIGLVAAGLVAVYWEAYHREPAELRVSVHALDLAGGATSSARLRILHLSDIQADRIGEHEDRAIREGLAQAPDLIVMTGDYVQPRLAATRASATADFKALLIRRGFRAPLGTFAVRGDVDTEWPRVLEGTGVRPLTGESVRVPLPGGRWLSLIGLTPGASRGHDREALLRLVRRVPTDDVRIVIGHNPDFVQTLASAAPVDLAVAGHTHGGQVVLPFFGPPYTKSVLPRRYASGVGSYRGQLLHVSQGVGMERGVAPQIRFLCPPEICVLDVRYPTRSVPAS